MNKQKIAVGVAILGVTVSGVYVFFIRPHIKRWEATGVERQQPLPGDAPVIRAVLP